MIEPGKLNLLKVVKEVEFGLYLDGGEAGEILLPKRYVPENISIDDTLEVFLYFDSEDRLIATTEQPKACVDEFAFLEVIGTSSVGAFLDWGLPKDLFLPFAEQRDKVNKGDKLVVFVRVDTDSNRLVASAKVERYLDNTIPEFEVNQEVDLFIFDKSPMGYKAIINETHSGLIYKDEVFGQIEVGDRVKGYIKKIREDEKIDLLLHKPGYEKIDDSAVFILDYLKKNKGVMHLSDKSDAARINEVFGISKKTFKKALGSLYKQKMIRIEEDKVSLL